MTDYLYRPPYGAKGQTEWTRFDTGLAAANSELTLCNTHRLLTQNAHGLIYTGNGTGGLLDADFIDGQHASAFALSGHNHSGVYLPVSGAGDIYTHNAAEFAVSGHNHSGTYEPVLGNPAGDNYLLKSSTLGVRGWTDPATFEASGSVSTHAALTTGVHGLAITAGQTLTVTTGGTLGSAAYTASGDYTPIAHKTTEDALNGLVFVNGAGAYSAKVIGTDVQAFNSNLTGINQALDTTASPTFATAKLTNLTDGYLPYHVSDTDGLSNSPWSTDGSRLGYPSVVSTRVFTFNPNVSGTTSGFYSSPTLTATANGGSFTNLFLVGFINKGTYTGLTYTQLRINDPFPSGTGTIDNQYQLYIATPTGGTNNYAIYSVGGMNYFGGNVGIGVTALGTSAAKVFGIGSGTAPTTAPADMSQTWVEDINGAAGYAGLHKMTETTAAKEIVPGVVIKGTTGRTTNPYESLIEINTFDNLIAMYADAGWRTLASGWA